jgi:CRISPR-associated protein Csm4
MAAGWYLVKLSFHSPLHVGHDQAGIGVENVQTTIHSDTLFSALVSAAAQRDPALVDKLVAAGALRFSSCFPYDRNHYYLPRPLLPPPAWFGPDARDIRQTDFLVADDFLFWVSARLPPDRRAMAARGRRAADVAVCEVRPRNVVDRASSHTVLYHCGGVTFKHDAGLFFILEADDDGRALVEQALDTLSVFGLGGERSSGYGRFTYSLVETQQPPWPELRANQGDVSCLLSLWYPAEDELRGLAATAKAYRTIPRKGWLFSAKACRQMKRKTCHMFAEGSVFGLNPVGCVADLTPPGFSGHDIHRWGRALAVPMKLPEGSW